jgi:NHLM bacteriocin system ABC transporter peptidase/ATP-binding protein
VTDTIATGPPPIVLPPGHKRVRTPSILQMEALECGAAALGIILAYYGRWVSLEELRAACGVSRDGSRAANVLRAARRYGLVAKGMRIEPQNLGELKLPIIVFWNFNHFLVVDGFGKAGVHLQDPAVGSRTVTWDEFGESFTGVALSLEPGEAFQPGGSPPSAARGLLQRLSGAYPALVLCLLAGLGLLIPGLVVPAGVRLFVDQYLVAANRSWLWVLVAAMALAAVVQVAFTWLQQLVLVRLSTKLSLSMSTRFFGHVLRLPITFFTQRYAGHVVSRVQLNDQIANLLSSQLSATALSFLTATLYIALMFVYDWQLTLVAVALAGGNVVAGFWGRRSQQEANRRIVQAQGSALATAVAGLANIEALKATSEEDSFFARWAGQQAKLVTSQQDVALQLSVTAAVPTLMSSLTTAAVIGIGALQVINGRLSLGTLTAFQVLVGGFMTPLGMLMIFGQTVRQAAASLTNIDDVLEHPVDPSVDVVEAPEPPGQTAAPQTPALPPAASVRAAAPRHRLSGAVELRGVTFGYSPLDPPLIEDFCLQVAPGQRVALVGTTASGKSTISRLAAGLQQPWSGAVLLDGVDRRDIPRSVLAMSLSLVDQDIHLFEGTVHDNITLWDPTIEEAAVARAAMDAAIHDDIVKRPGGYSRHILEGGADWSGGQRQRLEIARVLANDPTVLILDEATSALDPIVEVEIDEHVRARGCTCLIVAHRLSTIRDCDEIVVLDQGKVVERGRHEDLLALGGTYAGLVGE